eukprot:g28436.t1
MYSPCLDGNVDAQGAVTPDHSSKMILHQDCQSESAPSSVRTDTDETGVLACQMAESSSESSECFASGTTATNGRMEEKSQQRSGAAVDPSASQRQDRTRKAQPPPYSGPSRTSVLFQSGRCNNSIRAPDSRRSSSNRRRLRRLRDFRPWPRANSTAVATKTAVSAKVKDHGSCAITMQMEPAIVAEAAASATRRLAATGVDGLQAGEEPTAFMQSWRRPFHPSSEPSACASGFAELLAEEDDASLHLLQRRERQRAQDAVGSEDPGSDAGVRYSAFLEDHEDTPPPLTPMVLPPTSKRRKSLDLHFNAVIASCGSKLSDPARCNKAVVKSAESVFVQLHVEARMDEKETSEFRDRFKELVVGDSKRVVTKKSRSEQYSGWKNLVQSGYMAMRPVTFSRFQEEEEMKNHTLSMLQQDLSQFSQEELSRSAFDEEFDVRENWPECKPITSHVRYQTCNNCWSHATALITESRLCIQSRGQFNGDNAWLSQSFIAACRLDGRDYCMGGSGLLGFKTVSRTLDRDLFFVQYEPRALHPVGDQVHYLVKQALMQDGPILLGMRIYQDFYAYESGIYQPTRKSWNLYMGGHAVTGMGFGPGYVLAVNSWSTSWGINGAFKVAPQAVDFGFFLPGRPLGTAFGLEEGAEAGAHVDMLQSKEFQVDDLVYVPCEGKAPFLRGRVQALREDEVLVVQTEHATITAASTELRRCFDGDVCQDNTSLVYLNDATILQNLKARHQERSGDPADDIYTYTASVLLAVNPYHDIERLYGPEQCARYRGKHIGALPPHPYAIADAAYRALVREHRNQGFIISGESGAGKTETAKIASRTRYKRFFFDETGTLMDAGVTTYLLESSRVVMHSSSERTYHCFYEMLSGLPKEKLLRWHLEPTKRKRHLLLASDAEEMDETERDAKNFRRLCDALAVVGFSQDDMDSTFQVLAGLVHLGDLSLAERDEGDETSTVQLDEEILAKAAGLLGMDATELAGALRRRKVRVTHPGRESLHEVPRTTAQFRHALHSLIKALYKRLFERLVFRINGSFQELQAARGHCEEELREIGILDIYGFERLQRNSFEQLCINLANERLQQYFVESLANKTGEHNTIH